MTLEEAKKILKKEGYDIEKVGRPCSPSIVFTEYESPEICEAMQVVCSAGYDISMVSSRFNERKARLSLELAENTKAPGPGEEQSKEKKGIIYPTTFPKADFYHKHVLNEGNPAIAESASQFNDALLDEQAKKIAELTKEKSNLEDQITVLNACKKHNDKIDRKQIKCLGKEIARLNGIIHDKNAILADVAEELRLTKIREKNLAELGLKYVGENEKLKKELADKVVDKIDAQALKSAESALAWKEKVVTYKDMALAYDEKKIADLGKELKAQKDLVDDISLKYDGAKHNLKLRIEECEKLKKELEKMTKLVETVRKGSKEYCDYGIAAGKMIQKMAKVIVNEGPVSSEDFKEYRRLANGGIFMSEISEEELMKLQEKACVDIAEEGKDHSSKVVLCGKDVVKKFKENEESVFDFFKSIAKEADEFMFIESGHLGGNGVFDQMEVVKPSQRFKSAVCDARLELLYFIS